LAAAARIAASEQQHVLAHSSGVLDRQGALLLEHDEVVAAVLDLALRLTFVPSACEATPRRCSGACVSKRFSRACASCAISSGTLLRAVKLLPMNRTFSDLLERATLVDFMRNDSIPRSPP
jgi:hypothetical protein